MDVSNNNRLGTHKDLVSNLSQAFNFTNNLSYSPKRGSEQKRWIYPPCGTVDFMHIRKGRCFLEPLLSRSYRQFVCQKINGLNVKNRKGRAICFSNTNLIACAKGTCLGVPKQDTEQSQTQSNPVIYATNFVVA